MRSRLSAPAILVSDVHRLPGGGERDDDEGAALWVTVTHLAGSGGDGPRARRRGLGLHTEPSRIVVGDFNTTRTRRAGRAADRFADAELCFSSCSYRAVAVLAAGRGATRRAPATAGRRGLG